MKYEDGDGRPTREMVRDLAREEFGRHSQRREENERMMRLVNKDFKPFTRAPDPRKWKPVIPGTAGSLIHRAAGQIIADVPIVTYHPRNNSATAQEAADLVEQWGEAFLEAISVGQMSPPLEDAGKRALLGMWCLKGPLFDFDVWGDPPTKGGKTRAEYEDALARYYMRQAEYFPFMVTSVDPNSIVWDESNPLNPRWSLQRYRLPKSRLKRLWPKTYRHSSEAVRKQDEERVQVLEYWSPEWRMVLADEDVVSFKNEVDGDVRIGPIENVYGYVPYQIGFGSWGFASDKPEEMSRSLLYWIEEDIYEEARVASLLSWQAQLYGMTPIVAPDAERFMAEMAEGPGAVISLGASGEMKDAPRPMEMPEPPAWLESYQANIDARMIRDTFSRSVLGERSAGTTSGVFQGLQIGESKLLFRTIIKRLGRQSARLLNRAAFIVEQVIQEPMSIWHQTPHGRELLRISPDDWAGAYHYNVDLEPVDPTSDDRRGMLGLNYFAQGLLDPWTVLEKYLRHPNATAVIKKIILWRVMQTPEYITILAQDAAEESGLDRRLEQLKAEAAGEGGEDVAPRGAGDFKTIDMAAAGQVPLTPGGEENIVPEINRNAMPREGASRLSPAVTKPLETRESRAR